jgi:hypothetical protein
VEVLLDVLEELLVLALGGGIDGGGQGRRLAREDVGDKQVVPLDRNLAAGSDAKASTVAVHKPL